MYWPSDSEVDVSRLEFDITVIRDKLELIC